MTSTTATTPRLRSPPTSRHDQLASNTTYQVQVRAKNDEGEGPWATGIGATERTQLTIAFSATTYTVGEGRSHHHGDGHANR